MRQSLATLEGHKITGFKFVESSGFVLIYGCKPSGRPKIILRVNYEHLFDGDGNWFSEFMGEE